MVETKLTVAQHDRAARHPAEAEGRRFGLLRADQGLPRRGRRRRQTRLAGEYRATIGGQIYPVLTRLRDFLRDEYLPAARDGAGLMYMKGGERLYQELIEQTTTLPLTADEIHQLGLSEVARITDGMEAVKTRGRLQGHAGAILRPSAHRPQVQGKDAARALTQRYYDIGKTVDAKLPAFFSTIPEVEAGDPPVRAVPREVRGGRELCSRGSPDGVAAGHLLFQRLRPAVADHAGDHDALSPRRRAGASFPDQPGAGE